MSCARRNFLSAGASLVALSASSGCFRLAGWQGDTRRKIAVVPKGNSHLFWRAVAAGVEARKIQEHAPIDVRFLGPDPEDSAEAQSNLLYRFAAQGVAAICIAPCDQRALVGAVKFASARGVPVIVFDSSLDAEAGKDYVTEISTANEEGGVLAGTRLAKLLEPGKKVVVLRYRTGSQSTTARETGALAALRSAGCEIISENQEAATDPKSKVMAMGDILARADALFTPNESTTFGALLGLRELGLAGKLRFVGFDSSPPLLSALRAGEIAGLVVQDPKEMGRRTLDAAFQVLAGVSLPSRISLPAVYVDDASLARPEVMELLSI